MADVNYSIEDGTHAALSYLEALLNGEEERATEIINSVGTTVILQGSFMLNTRLLISLTQNLPVQLTVPELISQIRAQL